MLASHYKIEAGTEAALMRDLLERIIKAHRTMFWGQLIGKAFDLHTTLVWHVHEARYSVHESRECKVVL